MPSERQIGSGARRDPGDDGGYPTGPNSPITQWQSCCQVATACCVHHVRSLDAIGTVVGLSAPTVRKRLDMLRQIGIWTGPTPEGRIIVVQFEPEALPIGRIH